MLFICHPTCTTCKKAARFLEERGISFTFRDIREDRPTEKEIRAWQKESGLNLRRFFNTSGLKYRELMLKDKLETMEDDEQIALLASDGMLVKRPILVKEDAVLVGFKQKEWEESLF